MTPSRPRYDAVYLSPHLDDAVFSAGLDMHARVAAGERVALVTVFTASVPDPAGFALACQTDKGLPPEADYMSIRRAEDHAAAARLGLEPEQVFHLPLPEAPHRGYTDAADLFGGVHADDAGTPDRVAEALRLFADAGRWMLPLGLGHHVDHLQVIEAVRRTAAPPPCEAWFDTPYHLKPDVTAPPPDRKVKPNPAAVAAKLDACAAYSTQLPFQFGGERAMRQTLAGVAEAWIRLDPVGPGGCGPPTPHRR